MLREHERSELDSRKRSAGIAARVTSEYTEELEMDFKGRARKEDGVFQAWGRSNIPEQQRPTLRWMPEIMDRHLKLPDL